MKRAGFFVAGLLGAMLIIGTACGGKEAATATPRPVPTATTVRPTSAPTATPTAGATVAPTTGGALDIGSVESEDFKFSKDSLSAKAGAQVTVKFKNNAKVNQHNLVFVKAGTKDAVASAGTAAPSTDWVKLGDPNVIANTKLTDPGKTNEVTFTVPPAGTYQFVCTFPGHSVTMFGAFTSQ